MAPIFAGQHQGESLSQFLKTVVEPKERDRQIFGVEVDTVVKFLQNNVSGKNFTVAEVYKGGSQKKGTTVRESSDIDLVVYLNGIDSITDLQRQRCLVMACIRKEIKKMGWIEEDRPELSYRKKKKFGISCKVGDHKVDKHKVDILPAFDAVGKYKSPAEIYKAMERFRQAQKTKKTRRKLYVGLEFSASLSPLQVDFIKCLPAHVKSVIRLLKKWKEEIKTPKPRKLIPSYCLELLAAYQWKTKGTESIDTLFCDVLKMLSDCSSVRVAMDYDNQYDLREFTRNRIHPYILDPVNPFNNTFLASVSDFSILEREAQQALRKLRD